MKRLRLAIRVIDLASVWMGKIVSFWALAMMFAIVYEVGARYFLHRPTIWVEETSQFLLTGYFLLGGASCLYFGGHVKMDLVYQKLSLRKKAILDVVMAFFFFFLMFILIWQGWNIFWEALTLMQRTNSAWNPLTFPVKMTAPVGCFLLLLQGLAKFIRNLITAITAVEAGGIISRGAVRGGV